MAEYIRRMSAMTICERYRQHCFESNDNRGQDIADRIFDEIVEIPTVDDVEVRHGRWEVTEHSEHLNVICSNCNEDFYVYKKGQYRIDRSNYCPKCGARMECEG